MMKDRVQKAVAVLLRWAGVVLFWHGTAHAHHCGPARLVIEVGRTVAYRITADVSESEPSRYNLSINSDPAVATASPDNFESLNYGEFLIQGVHPGTNQFVFEWFYDPNQASGFCVVQVVVVPRGSMPPTAASQPQSGHAGDPVNTYTGEFLLAEEPDLQLRGPMPLFFSRYYASGLARSGIAHGSLGANWSHNFDHRLLRLGNQVEVISDRGRVVRFEKVGSAWALLNEASPPYQLVEEGEALLFGEPQTHRVLEFNARGQLVRIEDGRGNAHVLSYTGNNLASVSDGLGRELTFSYFGLQQLRSVQAGSRQVQFNFGGSEELSSVRHPAAQSSVVYSNQHSPAGPLLTERLMPLLNTHFRNTYDALGRIQSQQDTQGNTYTYSWPAPGTSVVTDPHGHSRRHAHNALGQLVSVQDEAAQVIQLQYDTAGNRSLLVDREGGVTATAWQDGGRPAAVTNADGTVLRYTYQPRHYRGLVFHDLSRVDYPDGTFEAYGRDDRGNILSLTNAQGSVWTYSYNSRGQVLTARNPAGGLREYSYHADGSLANVVVNGNQTHRFDYDGLGRLIRETHPDGSARSFGFDAMDRMVAMTNELGGVYTYEYDSNGNRVLRRLPGGMVERYRYDAMDRLVAMEGPSGVEMTQRFDASGRTVELVFDGDRTNRFDHDAVGNVVSVSDGEGSAWIFGFDAEGIVSRQVGPLGETNAYASDSMGRVTAVRTGAGNTRQYQYDEMGRWVQLSSAGGVVATLAFTNTLLGSTTMGTPGLRVSHGYDSLGLEMVLEDPAGGLWHQERDTGGRRTASVDPLGRRTQYEYDVRARLSRAVFAGGLGEVAIEYDGLNAITRRRYSDGVDLVYRHDSAGQLTNATGVTLERDVAGRMIVCNGVAMTRAGQRRIEVMTYAPGKEVVYAYNRRDQVTSMADWSGGITTFEYDAAGRMTVIRRPNGLGTRIEYDAENRITRMVHTNLGSLNLTRDADGRVRNAERDLPLPLPWLNQESTHAFDAAHQWNAATYDALGRIRSDGVRTWRWDLASRLVEFSEHGVTNRYTYDAFGYRLSRQSGNEVEQYVWNYGMGIPSLLTVRDGAGMDLWHYLYTPGGQLMEAVNAETGERYFYHYDELGNTLWLTDHKGAVVARYLHGPYGEVLASESSVPNPFVFQGKYGVMEDAGGMSYLRARYLDRRSGRFLSRDPLAGTLPKAANPYQYALGNPMRYQDPLGLQAIEAQDPAAPGGQGPVSARASVGAKATTASGEPPEAVVPASQPGSAVVFLTHEEWNAEVRATKRKLHDLVKKAEWGWMDPQIPATFDSGYLRRQKETFYFRGLWMNGGELNYYFQGMYWKELGVPKSVMIGIIFAYKQGKYGRNPSVQDLYAACHGYEDNANWWTELRDEALHYGEVITSVPGALGEVVSEAGSTLQGWLVPLLPSFGE